jgi:hypothetical protein
MVPLPQLADAAERAVAPARQPALPQRRRGEGQRKPGIDGGRSGALSTEQLRVIGEVSQTCGGLSIPEGSVPE